MQYIPSEKAMFWKSKKLKEYKLEEDPTYHEYCSNHPLADEIEFEWQLNTPINEDYPDDYCKDCPECKGRDGQVRERVGEGAHFAMSTPSSGSRACLTALPSNYN